MDDNDVGLERIAPTVTSMLGADVARVDIVAGSVANRDFLVDLTDRRRVFVKTGPRSELVAEAWALERAATVGVPVPRVLAFADDSDPGRSPLLILELLPTDGNQTRPVLHAVGRALTRIHSIELPGYGNIGRSGDSHHPDLIAGKYRTWQDYVAAILADVDGLVDLGLLSTQQASRIHRRADALEPSPLFKRRGSLLHSDLKRPHILSVAGELTGIIDWGDASVGDPAWDLARASMMEPSDFHAIIDGYQGALDDGVQRLLPLYRVLWNIRALAYEYRAGGDWFAEYQRRIAEDLDR